jgi:phosphomevalonate kinase
MLLAIGGAATLLYRHHTRATAQPPLLSVATSNPSLSPRVTASAPGKVLVTGGYQVLEKPRRGIVVAGDARFHTSAQWKSTSVAAPSTHSHPDHVCYVVVRSGQFARTSCYEISSSSSKELCQVVSVPFYDDGTCHEPPSHNPYVHTTLVYCMTALMALMEQQYLTGRITTATVAAATAATPTPTPLQRFHHRASQGYLDITLNADNCFYSQQQVFAERQLPPLSSSYAKLEPFARPTTVSKTGLGSSATLVSSLVGALMMSVSNHTLPRQGTASSAATQRNVALAHQLSQLCHVVAQGKVGSGFDVCTAVYGSICYERYTPALLGRFLNGAEDQEAAPLTAQDILDVLDEEQWDHCALPFGLPTGIEMVLGDIAQGSSTPSMVRAFFCCGWLC